MVLGVGVGVDVVRWVRLLGAVVLERWLSRAVGGRIPSTYVRCMSPSCARSVATREV